MIWVGLLLYRFVSHPVVSKDEYSSWIFMACIVLPLIFFPFYFLYLRYRQRHQIISWLGKKMPSVYSEFSFREIQVVLAVAMIKRDRHHLMVKKSRIRQFIQIQNLAKELDSDEIVEVFLSDKIPLMDLVEWCNRFISDDQKLDTFRFLADVSLIDQELTEEEKEYLLFIIQKFGIRNQDIPEEIVEKLFGTNKKAAEAPFSIIQSYYEVLEVASDATDKQVKESYRRLVKQFHPDSHPHLTAEEKQVLSDKFRKVQEAYDRIIGN